MTPQEAAARIAELETTLHAVSVALAPEPGVRLETAEVWKKLYERQINTALTILKSAER